MERITLEQFRDEVVLCTDIEVVIEEVVKSREYEIPRSIIQMLLVLGERHNSYYFIVQYNTDATCSR